MLRFEDPTKVFAKEVVDQWIKLVLHKVNEDVDSGQNVLFLIDEPADIWLTVLSSNSMPCISPGGDRKDAQLDSMAWLLQGDV